MNVLVTGGTGFVGNILVNLLCARSDRVTVLTRNPERFRSARAGMSYVAWPVDVSKFDAVVNLAGAGVLDRRWNDAYKAELRASRVDLTRRLVDAMAASPKRPRALISASAVGFYGDRGEELLPESSAPADGFLSQLCVDWEAEANKATQYGVRVATVRIGLVLGSHGGALKQMTPIFKLGLGGPFGSGQAWFPWIHVNDLCSLMIHAISGENVSGPLNGAAPGIVRNKEYVRTFGRVLSRPAFLPVPPFALRIALGEVASVLTASQHTVPERTLATGFRFQFPELEPALRNLLHKK
ncbi:MAG: TIGR01777 family oxidoreductase [Planctomycetota bacterium]|nr:TIGR01777 family oxidoreductase [Planctomycetota bacterium]